MDNKDLIVLYENGKQRRYNLLFTVNGGAFAIAKLFQNPDAVLGGLTLKHLSIGMIIFTIIMVLDIFAFGIGKSKSNPDLFRSIGKVVLISLGLLIVVGWCLVGFG